ncbi:RagB/SusD family nutrient uptake outer membrane protein [Carboxylicivirga sp. RSCT41]|uniref:RagB/SusD family nutrient uptake outer membrane protein n=1 Tax=Carboxylicivirga agarovorans TaxID=3417570 RepID=UPI003D356562
MKTLKIYFFALLILMGASNCSDEFLERTPSDQVSSATFFQQEKDIEYALNAVYDLIGFNSWNRSYGSGTDLLRIEVLTDNAVDHHSWNACYELGNGTANAYDWYVQYRWQERYRGIMRANRLLEGAPNVEDMDMDYRNRLVAEATVLRAYFYFDLVYLFGDVPFLTSSIIPDDCEPMIDAEGNVTPNPMCTRTDKNTIMDALVADLETVVNHLPKSYDSDDKGRVTQGTALTLQARIHLYREEWTQAAAASKAVMDLNVYSIYPTYANMFDYQGVDNEEVIFDIQVMKDVWEGEFWLPNYGPNSVGGWSCSCPLQSLIDTYETTDGKTIDDPTSIYDPAMPYANRDPRLHHSILYPGREWQWGVYNTIPGATYPGEEIVAGDDLTDGTGGQWNKSATGYNWIKYISQQDIDDGNYWDSGIHFIIMRYAEVLLMYAEAKIEAGDVDQSVYDAINDVRQRGDVMMPAITAGKSIDELREIVRRERRVELTFEGIRLYDIRRWKIAEQVMPGESEGLTYTDPDSGEQVTLSGGNRNFDPAKHYLWPIPQAEIDVSGITQNNNW